MSGTINVSVRLLIRIMEGIKKAQDLLEGIDDDYDDEPTCSGHSDDWEYTCPECGEQIYVETPEEDIDWHNAWDSFSYERRTVQSELEKLIEGDVDDEELIEVNRKIDIARCLGQEVTT